MEPLDPLDQLMRGRDARPAWTGLQERARAWATDRWPWLLAASVIAGIAVVVLVVRTPAAPPVASLPRAGTAPLGSTLPTSSGSSGSSGSSPPASSTAGAGDVAGPLVVHVAGAVVRPGLVTLAAGARVADAVAASGGLRPDADGDRLNLAAPLADGVRVYVPTVGQADPPDVALSGGGGASVRPGSSSPTSGPVDLNTATAAELDALPGVGPSTSAAIVAYRTEHRRFRSVDELQEVRGIGPAKFETLRPLVVVGS